MTIMRPASKVVLNKRTGALDMPWDNFFNDAQNALNSNQVSISSMQTALGTIQVELTSMQLNANFTMNAATSTTIADSRVTANSHISLTPTNADAANLVYYDSLYISARVAGVSFTVHTLLDSAAGTETFSYTVIG
jgi:hypothetical protein